MPRVRALLECLGLALCDKARKPLAGDVPFGEVLPDLAKATLDYIHKELTTDDIRKGLGELAAMKPEEYAERLFRLADGLAKVHSVPNRGALIDYLSNWPGTVRQVLRRPSDPNGHTAPDGLQFYKPDDLLVFLPTRRAKLRPGIGPDDWNRNQFRGMGECSEVWVATSESQPEHSPAALKFVTDGPAAERLKAEKDLLLNVFDLNDVAGIVPLRSADLEHGPPCLESSYVFGYDLTGVMLEWKWRFDAAKPEAALKIMRRVAEIVGKAHKRGVVHRDLKPSNVLLHPTEGGKFTIWVSDFGWGQIAAVREMELTRGGTPRGEQQRLALRGAHTPLYASPQLAKKDPPDLRDDVHALGAIWYQLLKRDPHAAPPIGTDWAEEFRAVGVTDSQAKLLSSCLSTRPEKRPADAATLAEMLHNVAVAVSNNPADPDGSMVIKIKSGEHTPVPGAKPGSKSGKFPPVAAVAAKMSKAELLAAIAGASAQAADGLPRMVANSIGMTFALVPGGAFKMGSPENEPARREHEGPQRDVTVSHRFYLGVFPVTQGQYEKVMGRNPSHFDRSHGGGPDFPVETVTWHESASFCRKLGLLPEEEINGRTYRLPTEAEWEYACRAGTVTAYSFGATITPKNAHYAAAGVTGKSGGKTAPVGSSPPNPWGLHDLHGNVQEWVQDWYDEYYYIDGPAKDPPGPAQGALKVIRGGCWTSFGSDCRSASRKPHAPDSPSNAIGFRVVMTVPDNA